MHVTFCEQIKKERRKKKTDWNGDGSETPGLCLDVFRTILIVFWPRWKVDGCVFAIYNVGMMDHAIGVQQRRVSDGLYHVVRFTRDGPNSTLQIDQLPVQHKRPTGNTNVASLSSAIVSLLGVT